MKNEANLELRHFSRTSNKMLLLIMLSVVCCQCMAQKAWKKELVNFRQMLNEVPDATKLEKIRKYEILYPATKIRDEILFHKGQLTLERKNYAAAIECFNSLWAKYPLSIHHFAARYAHAVALYELNLEEESKEVLEATLMHINVLERNLKRTGLMDRSKRKILRQQLQQAGKPAYIIGVRSLLGKILLKKEDYNYALMQFRIIDRLAAGTSLNTREFRYNLTNQMALCHYTLLEFDKAFSLLEKNIEFEKEITLDSYTPITATKLLGVIYRDTGRETEALQIYLNGMQLSLSQSDRDYLTTNVQTMIETEMDEQQLLRVINHAGGDYPGNIALFQLLHLYDDEQRYEEMLNVIKTCRQRLSNNEDRQKIETLYSKTRVKIEVNPGKIGFIGPLSGQYSLLGLEIARGVRFALDEFNETVTTVSQKIDLVEIDSESITEGSDQADIRGMLNYLVIEEKVMAIVGPVLSKSVEVAAPFIDEFQIVAITPATNESNLPALSPYLFRISLTFQQQVEALIDYCMDERGIRRFGVLFPQTPNGVEFKTLFENYVSRRYGQIMISASYPDDTNDFSDILLNFQHKNIEALFIPDYSSRVAEIAPQLAFYDILPVTILGTNLLNSPDLIELGGKYVENIIFTDSFFSETESLIERDFIDRYQAVYGLKPTRYAAQAYDSTKLLLSQIHLGATTREALRHQLTQVSQFRGVTGDLSFNEQGEVQRSLNILSVQGGLIVRLD